MPWLPIRRTWEGNPNVRILASARPETAAIVTSSSVSSRLDRVRYAVEQPCIIGMVDER